MEELWNEVFRFSICDQEATASFLQIGSEVCDLLDGEASTVHPRFPGHLELRHRLGVETRVKAEDRQHLGARSGILHSPVEHGVVMDAKVVAEPEDDSVHFVRCEGTILVLVLIGYLRCHSSNSGGLGRHLESTPA